MSMNIITPFSGANAYNIIIYGSSELDKNQCRIESNYLK